MLPGSLLVEPEKLATHLLMEQQNLLPVKQVVGGRSLRGGGQVAQAVQVELGEAAEPLEVVEVVHQSGVSKG
jgi:hypothetical protein